MPKLRINKKILGNKDFEKEKTRFFFIYRLMDSDTLLFKTDNANYAIYRGDLKYQTWVWTKDNLGEEKLAELDEVLQLYLTGKDAKFTTKEEIYDYLNQNPNYLLTPKYKMGTLSCLKAIKPKECDGYLDHAKEEDVELLAKYWYDDHQEMRGVDAIPYEEAYEDACKLPQEENFYVWRNNDGLIVAFAGYNIYEGLAKIGPVYTAPDYRRRGYCANLIYTITNNLLNQGYQVLLYTDYEYQASNNAYKKVGFEDNGYLVNFTLTKKKR